MTEKEYSLEKSQKIGHLYPILKDSKGRVIDGEHRLKVNPNWKTETLKEIDSDEKFIIARCVANWNRRQISEEEKREWINALAEIYFKQGIAETISAKLSSELGLTDRTIRTYLDDKYKKTQMVRYKETKEDKELEELARGSVKPSVQKVEQEVRQKVDEELERLEKEQKEKPQIGSSEEKEDEGIPSTDEQLDKLFERLSQIKLQLPKKSELIIICPKCGHKFKFEEPNVIEIVDKI